MGEEPWNFFGWLQMHGLLKKCFDVEVQNTAAPYLFECRASFMVVCPSWQAGGHCHSSSSSSSSSKVSNLCFLCLTEQASTLCCRGIVCRGVREALL